MRLNDDKDCPIITIMKALTSDEQVIELSKEFQTFSNLISSMISLIDDDSDEPIPLCLKTKTLNLMLSFCEKYTESNKVVKIFEDLEPWEQDFLNIEFKDLIELTEAANYVDFPRLYEFCVLKICDFVKNKTYAEIRKMLCDSE